MRKACGQRRAIFFGQTIESCDDFIGSRFLPQSACENSGTQWGLEGNGCFKVRGRFNQASSSSRWENTDSSVSERLSPLPSVMEETPESGLDQQLLLWIHANSPLQDREGASELYERPSQWSRQLRLLYRTLETKMQGCTRRKSLFCTN